MDPQLASLTSHAITRCSDLLLTNGMKIRDYAVLHNAEITRNFDKVIINDINKSEFCPANDEYLIGKKWPGLNEVTLDIHLRTNCWSVLFKQAESVINASDNNTTNSTVLSNTFNK